MAEASPGYQIETAAIGNRYSQFLASSAYRWRGIRPMNYVFKTTAPKRYRFPTHINDLVMDRAEARCSEVFLVLVEPGGAPPLHRHEDTEQVFYILEGDGVLSVGDGGERHPVAPGDVVRIPIDTLHSIRALPGRTLKYLCVDCFGGNGSKDEPTWEAHVRVLCRSQGWDYSRVAAAANKDEQA
jgi:mannose-6-phosphate isomerase-like protein (cupin superfamily)